MDTFASDMESSKQMAKSTRKPFRRLHCLILLGLIALMITIISFIVLLGDNIFSDHSVLPQVPSLIPRGSVTLESGVSPLRLICTTRSSGSITYKFLQDSTVVQSSASNTYTINSPAISDSGIYICRASNSAGDSTSTDSYAVTVVDKPATPVITTDNSNPEDGDSITLNCTSATSAVNGYAWILDGVDVRGQTSQTYTMSQADIGTHDGSYTCIVYIDTVASNTSAALAVALLPQVPSLTPRGSATLESGVCPLTLTCATSSGGSITYKFLQDSTEVQSSASDTYTISSPATSDSGTYTCKASNSAGDSTSTDSYALTVVDKPSTPVVTTDNRNPVDGDSITLTCTSATSAVNGYVWKLDGVDVLGQTSQTYTMAQADIGTHDGSYTCVVYIDTVASDTSAAVAVALLPKVPSLIPTGSATLESVDSPLTLTCATSSGGSITYKFLKYSTVVQSSASNTYTISSPATSDSGTYTCKVTNKAGDSASSNSFRLSDGCSTSFLSSLFGGDTCGAMTVVISFISLFLPALVTLIFVN